jgi:hypothetical protein
VVAVVESAVPVVAARGLAAVVAAVVAALVALGLVMAVTLMAI